MQQKIKSRKVKHRLTEKDYLCKEVDVLVLGGGPAALGLLINAFKTNRHTALLQHDSIAIIDEGIAFGGGLLN